MQQYLYKVIYTPWINRVLRNTNKLLSPLLPAWIRIAPSGIITIRNGNRHLKIKTNQTNYLTYLIFWDGYKSFEYTEIFIQLIRKVDSFFDIGANIGYYSLLAAMENTTIHVTGFEPASGPLYYFKSNILLNHFKNIKLEPIALSHTSGSLPFYEVKNKKYSYLEHNLAGIGNILSTTDSKAFTVKPVPTITLDAYVKANNTVNIDLIKIDTEGSEYLILEHADDVLREMKPIIICETLFQVIENKLEEILLKYGYEFYNHTDSGLRKVPSIKREVDNGVRNCFFVHPSKYHLIEEFIDKQY